MQILKLLAVVGLLLSASPALAANEAEKPAKPDTAGKPNILFILADDFGLDNVSCYGSDRFKGKTPNIDALAASGIRFERGYCTPLCGPTRCQLITGRYGFRTGGNSNQSAGNPKAANEPSFAKTLKAAGYKTGMAGKWRQMGESPGDWGFDEFITDPTAGGWFWKYSYTENGKEVTKEKEIYYPDVTHQFTLDFLRRHKSEPFVFYYSSHLVHGPILRTPDTKPEDAAKANPAAKPAARAAAGGPAGPGAGLSSAPLYADNVAYLDKQVGELVAELEKLGLREKTLIVFTGDNGTAGRSYSINGRQIHGFKGQLTEGGTRVPLIASWKGTTPAGKVNNDLVDFSDFHTTFAELAGAKLPEGVVLDGHSIVPQLRGEKGTPREWIYSQLGARYFVRDDRYKLTQAGELFDLKDAPYEETPVPADTADASAKEARTRLEAVLAKLDPKSGNVEPAPPPAPKKAARAAQAAAAEADAKAAEKKKAAEKGK